MIDIYNIIFFYYYSNDNFFFHLVDRFNLNKKKILIFFKEVVIY